MTGKFIAATVGAIAIALWILAYGYFDADHERAMLIIFTIAATVFGRGGHGGTI